MEGHGGERSRLNETELLVIIIRVYREIIISRTHEYTTRRYFIIIMNTVSPKLCVCVVLTYLLHGIRWLFSRCDHNTRKILYAGRCGFRRAENPLYAL